MIESAEEFVRLRQSEITEEYNRAAHDSAEIGIWYEVIENYPDYKEWVIHNKTVPIEILEFLVQDANPKVRGAVARKRKINDYIFSILASDKEESVRYALMGNTKLPIEKKKLINTEDSEWLRAEMKKMFERKSGYEIADNSSIIIDNSLKELSKKNLFPEKVKKQEK